MAKSQPNGDEPNWDRTVPRDEPWGGCRFCAHFRPGMTCAAYPDRIPIAIASGEIDHLVVRPGQVADYVFVPAEHPTSLTARRLLENWRAATGVSRRLKAPHRRAV